MARFVVSWQRVQSVLPELWQAVKQVKRWAKESISVQMISRRAVIGRSLTRAITRRHCWINEEDTSVKGKAGSVAPFTKFRRDSRLCLVAALIGVVLSSCAILDGIMESEGGLWQKFHKAEEATNNGDAIVLLEKLIDKHESVRAMTLLADRYDQGKGVAKDPVRMLELLNKAASGGYFLAQYKLGTLYESGGGLVEKDESKAFYWYRRAAERGHSDAIAKIAAQRALERKMFLRAAEPASEYARNQETDRSMRIVVENEQTKKRQETPALRGNQRTESAPSLASQTEYYEGIHCIQQVARIRWEQLVPGIPGLVGLPSGYMAQLARIENLTDRRIDMDLTIRYHGTYVVSGSLAHERGIQRASLNDEVTGHVTLPPRAIAQHYLILLRDVFRPTPEPEMVFSWDVLPEVNPTSTSCRVR